MARATQLPIHVAAHSDLLRQQRHNSPRRRDHAVAFFPLNLVHHSMKFLFAALAFSSALMPLSVHAAATDAELIALSPNASSCSGVTGKQIIGRISRLSSFIHLSGPAVQLIVVTSTGARPLMVYNAGVSVSMQPMAHYELER